MENFIVKEQLYAMGVSHIAMEIAQICDIFDDRTPEGERAPLDGPRTAARSYAAYAVRHHLRKLNRLVQDAGGKLTDQMVFQATHEKVRELRAAFGRDGILGLQPQK